MHGSVGSSMYWHLLMTRVIHGEYSLHGTALHPLNPMSHDTALTCSIVGVRWKHLDLCEQLLGISARALNANRGRLLAPHLPDAVMKIDTSPVSSLDAHLDA